VAEAAAAGHQLQQAVAAVAVATAHPVTQMLQEIQVLLIGEGAEVPHGTDTVLLLEALVDPVSLLFDMQIHTQPQLVPPVVQLSPYQVDIEFTSSLVLVQSRFNN
jgi:hypothetical protein